MDLLRLAANLAGNVTTLPYELGVYRRFTVGGHFWLPLSCPGAFGLAG